MWLCLLPFRFAGREVTFIGWMGLRARRFGVGLPPCDEPVVRPTLSDARLAVVELPVGERAPPPGVMLLAADRQVDHLSGMFARVDVASRRKYYGDFVREGSASFADVCEPPAELAGMTLGEAMRRRAPRIV